MRRSVELQIITETLEGLIPGAAPVSLSVEVKETLSVTGCVSNTWTGTPAGLAERIHTALYGRPAIGEPSSPLAQADDAKRARDIFGEIGALQAGHDQLTSAPWYPARPGDLLHIHYEQAGDFPAFGETYLVYDAGHGLMGMSLLAHTLPDTVDDVDVAGMTGCFASEDSDEPLYEAWFEAGPHRLTIVRDGRPVHVGGAR
jgi:hypothetical protein